MGAIELVVLVPIVVDRRQFIPTSVVPRVAWPAIVDASTGRLLSVVLQLEQSQWWSAERLQHQQFEQLASVVGHAYRTVTYYRERFDGVDLRPRDVATALRWHEIPVLTRRDIQLAGEALHSSDVPREHGSTTQTITSGSTGQPVAVTKTRMCDMLWRAFTLRDHLWHQRDFGETLAAIRDTRDPVAKPPHGKLVVNWAFDAIPTGPGCMLGLNCSLDEQADWLQRIDPGYILAYPSLLAALAERVETSEPQFSRLREVRCFGELLDKSTRELLKASWKVPISDMYSCEEVGYIALQCPEHEHYHVQSENVFVEVLRDDGSPCEPGETGRVVVTSLNNFAMPLIRYEILDFAEVGPPCPCGRGLPVLSRIVGRQRNILTLPNGERRWPTFAEVERPEDLPPLFQFQVIQKTLQELEARVVRPGPFTPNEEQQMRNYLAYTLGHEFDIRFVYLDEIPRGPSGKFEDFRSELED